MSVLVTGAAGFAGSHLLDLLSTDGAAVVAWHRPGVSPPRTLPGVEWDGVDLLDRAAVAAAVRRHPPRAVYHCAGWAHVGRAWVNTEAAFAINVRATHFLVEALREASPSAAMLVPSSAM